MNDTIAAKQAEQDVQNAFIKNISAKTKYIATTDTENAFKKVTKIEQMVNKRNIMLKSDSV